MIAGAFWLLVANAAAILGTHALWRRIRTGAVAVDAVLFLVLRLVLISAAVAVAGLSGLLFPMAVGLAGAAVLSLLLLRGEHRQVRLPARPDAGRATAILVGLIVVRALAQVWFFAPMSGDALAYHLPKIGEWVRAGAFTREMGLDLCVTFPAGFELIETWWVMFLHHDLLIEMAGIEFAILGFAAVAALASSAGLSTRSSLLAAALYLLTPLFAIQIPSCLNDAPVAALVLAVMALVAALVHPLLIALPVGLGLGIKGSFLYALSGAVVMAWFRRDGGRLRPASIRWTIPPIAAAAFIGLYWYVRNALWYGNPVHPVTSQGLDLEGIHLQAGPRIASLGSNVSSLLTSLVGDALQPFSSNSTRTAGWGVTAFAAGSVGLIHGLREDRTLRILAAGFVLSLATVYLMVGNDAYNSRFVLFFPAILCIGAARLASISRPAAALVIAGALIQFASTCVPADLSPAKMRALVGQSWRERSVGPLFYTAELPAGEPVAVYATVRSVTSMLYGPDFSRRVVYLRVRDAEDLLDQMTKAGARYVYVDTASFHRRHGLRLLVEAGRMEALNPRLYRLR